MKTKRPTPELYLAFPKVIAALRDRISATEREIACWLFFEQIKAYGHVKEFYEPPEISLMGIALTDWTQAAKDSPPYLNALQGAYFLVSDIDNFIPPARYISFGDLIHRWSALCQTEDATVALIRTRIAQDRLHDFAPALGPTILNQTHFTTNIPQPPAEWAMFYLAEVEAIEVEDFPSSNHDSTSIFKNLDSRKFEKPDMPIEGLKPQIQFGQPEDLGVEETKIEPRNEPRILQRKQEYAIIEAINSLNHSPKEMPSNKTGSRGIRSDVREYVCEKHPDLFPKKSTVFKKAWERMSESEEICYRKTLPPQKT